MKKILIISFLTALYLNAEELSDFQKEMIQKRERLYNTENLNSEQKEYQYKKQNQYKYQYKNSEESNSGLGNMYKGSMGKGSGKR